MARDDRSVRRCHVFSRDDRGSVREGSKVGLARRRCCTELCWVGTTLYCTALHRNALYCTALQYTVLTCTVVAPHYTALHRTALYCTAVQCTELHPTAVHFTAVQHITELPATWL